MSHLNDSLLKSGGQLLAVLVEDGGPSGVNSGSEFPSVSFSFAGSFSPIFFPVIKKKNTTLDSKKTNIFLFCVELLCIKQSTNQIIAMNVGSEETNNVIRGCCSLLAATSYYNLVICLFPDLWIFSVEENSRFVYSHHVLEVFKGNENSH